MIDLASNVRDDDNLREAFFAFVAEVFGADLFRAWFERGQWTDAYVPHVLVEDGRVVANVSACLLDVLVREEPRKSIQLATVATLPSHRGRGLAARLMHHVLAGYGPRTDFQFLYGNENVTGFYPRFGFRPVRECLFRADVPLEPADLGARRLDGRSPGDFETVRAVLERRAPLTGVFGPRGDAFIGLWHAMNTVPHLLHHLAARDLLIAAAQGDGVLSVFDVAGPEPVRCLDVLPGILTAPVSAVEFHFTPDRMGVDAVPVEPPAPDPLFVRGTFPLEPGTFKFPKLAQT